MTFRANVGLAALLAACSGTEAYHCETNPLTTAADGPGVGEPVPPADEPAGPGGIKGGGSPPSGSDPTDPIATEPDPEPIRFLVLGDGGRGNAEQYAVAAGMEEVCAANGCDFAIYTGDVIYDDGVSSVDDVQFEEKFELPYQFLDFPFWISVGNHDHGGDIDAQVEYTAHSTKWTMPGAYYSFAEGDATFYALDTDPISEDDVQHQWLDGEIASTTTTWKFAFGHHPYISNGDHGDTGGGLAAVVEQSLCGNVDIYFAGHDHDLEWLEPVCDTEFIISGAASSLRDVGGDHPTFFETATLGFMWVEIVDRRLTGVFYDQDGNELFRRTLRK